MTTTTEASTEPDYFRQACAAHYAHGAIQGLLDGDPDAATMRTVLRDVLAEFHRAGLGVDL